jgi:hypothetical protein
MGGKEKDSTRVGTCDTARLFNSHWLVWNIRALPRGKTKGADFFLEYEGCIFFNTKDADFFFGIRRMPNCRCVFLFVLPLLKERLSVTNNTCFGTTYICLAAAVKKERFVSTVVWCMSNPQRAVKFLTDDLY